MMLFKKMCDDCKAIQTVKSFKAAQEFYAILEEARGLIDSGAYEYAGGNNPADTIRYWPQDGLWYRIRCKTCGTCFTLYYDIFEAKGCFKKGK